MEVVDRVQVGAGKYRHQPSPAFTTLSSVLLVLGTFGYCVASAMIPLFHAEAYLLAVSALAPSHMAVPLVLAATSGQMLGKAGMYGVGRGAVRVPWERTKRWIERAEAWCRERPKVGGPLIFVSAATGFPPFYVLSVAAGMVRAPFGVFCTLGFLGRLVRFSAVVLLPYVFRALK